jgi:hypothetical protein
MDTKYFFLQGKAMTKRIEMLEEQTKCCEIQLDDLKKDRAYCLLPDSQKIVVQNCLANAKRQKNGFRYFF